MSRNRARSGCVRNSNWRTIGIDACVQAYDFS
jgi:hypothetical protein